MVQVLLSAVLQCYFHVHSSLANADTQNVHGIRPSPKLVPPPAFGRGKGRLLQNPVQI